MFRSMASRKWYFADGSEAVGPIPEEDLRAHIDCGLLSPHTMVYTEELGKWIAWDQLPTSEETPSHTGSKPPSRVGPITRLEPRQTSASTPAQPASSPAGESEPASGSPPSSSPAPAGEAPLAELKLAIANKAAEGGKSGPKPPPPPGGDKHFTCPACEKVWIMQLTAEVAGKRFCKHCINNGAAARYFQPAKKKKAAKKGKEPEQKAANPVSSISFDNSWGWIVLALVLVAVGSYFGRIWLLDSSLSASPPVAKIGFKYDPDPDAPWAGSRGFHDWRTMLYHNEFEDTEGQPTEKGLGFLIRDAQDNVYAVTTGSVLLGDEEAGQGNWIKEVREQVTPWQMQSTYDKDLVLELDQLQGEDKDYRNLNALIWPVPADQKETLLPMSFKLDPMGPLLDEKASVVVYHEFNGRPYPARLITVMLLDKKEGLLLVSAPAEIPRERLVGAPVINSAGRLIGMITRFHPGELGSRIPGTAGYAMLSSRALGRPIGFEPEPYPEE